MDGVGAVGEFGADGSLRDYRSKMDMPREMAATIAEFCASGSQMLRTLATGVATATGMEWLPPRAWMYSGGNWSVVIVGNRGVFVDSSRADYGALIRALSE